MSSKERQPYLQTTLPNFENWFPEIEYTQIEILSLFEKRLFYQDPEERKEIIEQTMEAIESNSEAKRMIDEALTKAGFFKPDIVI